MYSPVRPSVLRRPRPCYARRSSGRVKLPGDSEHADVYSWYNLHRPRNRIQSPPLANRLYPHMKHATPIGNLPWPPAARSVNEDSNRGCTTQGEPQGRGCTVVSPPPVIRRHSQTEQTMSCPLVQWNMKNPMTHCCSKTRTPFWPPFPSRSPQPCIRSWSAARARVSQRFW